MPSSDRADRLDGEHDRREARRQPRQRDGDEQPAEHLRGQRERQQPAVRRPARDEVDLADERAGDDRHAGRDERRLEQRPGRAAQVAAGMAQDEQKARVGDGGEHAVERAERGFVAVGALADDARR